VNTQIQCGNITALDLVLTKYKVIQQLAFGTEIDIAKFSGTNKPKLHNRSKV